MVNEHNTWKFFKTHHFLELGLNLFRGELLAERGFPQEHVAVVGQQLWTLGLWLSFQSYPVMTEVRDVISDHFNRSQQKQILKRPVVPHPFCFMGSSNLNIVASFTTAL